MNALFLEIASFDHTDKSKSGKSTSHLDIKDKICLSEIVIYINRGKNEIFEKNVTKNIIVIKEAFKFAIGHKNAKNYQTHEMTKKEFKNLVPALLFFTELFNIFHLSDTSIDDDKIFPGEYNRAHNTISGVSGVTISNVSAEEWANEFVKIDTNKSGWITFSEFSTYCLTKIMTPTFYLNEIHSKEDEEDNVEDVKATDQKAGAHEESSQVSELRAPAHVESSTVTQETIANSSATSFQEKHKEAEASRTQQLQIEVEVKTDSDLRRTASSGLISHVIAESLRTVQQQQQCS